MDLPLTPPLKPMLAKLTDALPEGDGWLFEPKWDGFRVIVFRDGDILELRSRDDRPLLRYFPELAGPLRDQLPPRVVLDGELVLARDDRLDFGALQMRLHPAASRIERLSVELPAGVVLWDLLALGDESLLGLAQAVRRERLRSTLPGLAPPLRLTPATTERAIAADWLARFEGAGLDGVMAKPLDAPYQPGKRAMLKIKPRRTADCVVAGLRWHTSGEGRVGSLLLGLHDEDGRLRHVGVTSAFKMAVREQLAELLEPLRERALDDHPWADWAGAAAGQRLGSRWSAGKDMRWVPLRPERVCEVRYDHLQGRRFRHAAVFDRWRPDRDPADCRYDQLDVVPAAELAQLFGRPGGAAG